MKKRKVTKKAKRTRVPRAPRMTKWDRLVSQTVQDHAHRATSDIGRKRMVLECEQEVRELKITELRAQLADAQREKNNTDAVLYGLGAVIAAR